MCTVPIPAASHSLNENHKKKIKKTARVHGSQASLIRCIRPHLASIKCGSASHSGPSLSVPLSSIMSSDGLLVNSPSPCSIESMPILALPSPH
ncbi:hypothetical protein JTE90_019558 [Oedothorax gibbosus]|uniref:Uncharacterized protein n=1 Tax=Oedothorax gibbosus TaxID=931172 RepID=A0AAV6V4N6_9ARAC|nr:hypothetical protein JTE90_019558 [Oedothorax gibbosus]